MVGDYIVRFLEERNIGLGLWFQWISSHNIISSAALFLIVLFILLLIDIRKERNDKKSKTLNIHKVKQLIYLEIAKLLDKVIEDLGNLANTLYSENVQRKTKLKER